MVSRALDKRYKVTLDMVEKMKKLRKKGYSYSYIGERLGVSHHTVYYWLVESYRRYKRRLNALRKSDNKHRVELHKKQDKMFRKDFALGYIAKQVNAYQFRKLDTKILGVSMRNHWIPYLERYYYKGGRKLGI